MKDFLLVIRYWWTRSFIVSNDWSKLESSKTTQEKRKRFWMMIGGMIAKIFTMVFWALPAQFQVFVCVGITISTLGSGF